MDEAMVAVTTGSALNASGLVFCGVILGCQMAFELRRAQRVDRGALGVVPRAAGHGGLHRPLRRPRNRDLELGGAWPEALEEARRAAKRCLEGREPRAAGEAAYLEGEIHRLQGRFGPAEESYRESGGRGCEPQPGSRCCAPRRARPTRRLPRSGARRRRRPIARRARVLPALAEIALEAGDSRRRDAGAELEEIAAGSAARSSMPFGPRGDPLQLGGGAPEAALASLRRAAQGWLELDAPYEVARARELLAQRVSRPRRRGRRPGWSGTRRESSRGSERRRMSRVTPPRRPRIARAQPRELEVLRLVALGAATRRSPPSSS